MSISSIKFEKYVFNDGLNVTARRWVNHYAATGNYDFALVDAATGYKQYAKVVTYKHLRFCDITDDHLEHHHDPHIRTTEALLVAMKKHYSCFEPNEIVTLLYFDNLPF